MKKPVKVNKFDPIEPGLVMEHYQDGTAKRKSLGVPVRLMLANQILAGLATNSMRPSELVKLALNTADALIDQHNKDIDELESEG